MPAWRSPIKARSVSTKSPNTNRQSGKRYSTRGTIRAGRALECPTFSTDPAVDAHRPELADIALFVEVAKRKSFTRAAEALGIANSSLSRRIARLEGAVGVTLLRRTSRTVELTSLGQEYFERCRTIVDDAAAAHDQLVLAGASPRGRIRMSVPVDFGLLFIAPALVEFARRFRELTFDVDMSPRRVDIVGEGFDLAVRVGTLANSSTLITRRLATVGVALYASPRYLETAGTPEAPDDLAHHSCLRVLLSEAAEPWSLSRDGSSHAVVPQSRFMINNLSMLRQLTVAGCGIGAFDAVMADDDIRAGRLRRVLPGWAMPTLPIHLLTSDRRLPQRVRLWVDFLTERLRSF